MIYLDNNATTRIDPRVLETMMPFLTDNFANAASTHAFGVGASEAVKTARQQLADLIGAQTHEIVFTSGATEAINLAIKGVAEQYQAKGKHIVTLQTEHSAVLDVCKHLETKGFEVSYLPVQSNGLLDLDLLKNTLRKDTILVSMMAVNNEIGVVQPLNEIGRLAREVGVLFMTDGTQAVGKMPLNVDELGIDLMPMSAHKFYGPKGVGALFVRQRRPNRVKLEALLHGGGHEGGKRSGTLNVTGIVGMGRAAELAQKQLQSDAERVGKLRDILENELLQISGTRINGDRENRLYNVTNVLFEGCDSDALIMGLENIAVSNGSACTSASIDPSHVLMALGMTETEAFSCIRFSLGRFNTADEIPQVVEAVKKVVGELRAMSG
ncbi:cysteine desulfurase family protein [Runella salmonicolor]|uniref:cysteine desulfurase n=1 Tax=Runella salmonicolor TaxID=2950278 RepID=A0ABT1FJ76_9BACT|nr:aminotransferase class V-fold PLP-dependent enzyme [Runella salmonicolor]MCP1381826.1 aminotransferase class V-fold PLP-dependent enzyme [Runella salmonicolor]